MAIETVRKKVELDPNYPGAYLILGSLYRLKGMYREAIENLHKAVELSGGAPWSLSALGYTYGVSGRRGEARRVLRQLRLLSKDRYVSPYDIARVYIGLGENDLAFGWLGKAVAERSGELVFLSSAEMKHEMDSLRSDPRYAELKRRIGLPQ
jgi:Flp pilus assembly protein TadD